MPGSIVMEEDPHLLNCSLGLDEVSWKNHRPFVCQPEDSVIMKHDVAIEKPQVTRGQLHLGRSIVRLSGSLKDNTVITDRTIRIAFPDDIGIRTLNLIYDSNGRPNIPQDQHTGVYHLLHEQRPDLVYVQPVVVKETPEILQDIKQGSFDLIATSTENNSGLGNDSLQLIRIWKTGKFYTYNQRTGHINRLREHLKRSNSAGRYKVLPGHVNWNYSFENSGNYFKKYLLQDEIESNFVPRKHPSSFPERSTALPVLDRGSSSLSDRTKATLYQRYKAGKLPLEKSATGTVPRLTRSNVLRHEFYQHHHQRQDQDMDSHRKVDDRDDALQEDNLKCPTCRNFYDTRDRIPHILHCLHSSCNSCLKSRVRAEMVQCPVCTEVQEVPNNEVDFLPVDNARQHLVKFYKVRNRSQEIGCDSCDPRNRSTHRCKECDEFLCGVCTEAHKRTKVTKGHNIMPVEALRRSNLDEFHHKRTCPVPEHEDQPFSFYCNSKGCDMPICSLCAVTEHNKADGHDIRNINDVYVETKRVIESLLIDVKHKKNVSDEAIKAIEDEIQNLYLKENATDEELDQAFLACQKQLEKRKNELKEKLAATSKAKKKGMESQLDKLIGEKNALEHASKFSKNVLSYSDATEFLQVKDALFGRLGELKELEIDTRPHNKADMKFHSHKMMDAFQKFSNNMGEVWSTTAFIPHTKIQTYDIGLGREETCMMITLHDYEKRPLAEPGVDIRVDVANPLGKKMRAHVIDLTDSEGAYKAVFQGTKLGDHRASVFVLGMPVIDPGVVFKVRRPGALEDDVTRDYEHAVGQTRSKIDTGLPKSEDKNVKSSNVPGLRMTDDEDEYVRTHYKTRSYRVFGDIICPDFTYEPSTCHPQNMVTPDTRTLKNTRGRTINIGTALKNYRGVIGTKPFSKMGRFYFEVVVYFFIKRQLRNDLIFEIAIAQKSEIDKNYSVDGSPHAWTVCARRCPLCNSVCLMTFHNGVRLHHIKLTETAPPGTTLRTTIGLLVDMNAKQWYIVDAKNRRLFYRFKNIDTSKPLWPVFGVYSTEYVSVSLALKTGKDIQAVPDIPMDGDH